MPKLKVKSELTYRLARLTELFRRIEPVPDEWLKDSGTSVTESSLECIPCDNYKELSEAWKNALTWTDGLDHALSCTLAVAASTDVLGDQLWMKIIGPASCGKSTLAEAISVNKRYVLAKSTIRGFHSGFKSSSGRDVSLAEKCRGKTLTTKDGDTLLRSPNCAQILSEGRDIFDRVSRTSYRNDIDNEYEGLNMTWLLYGTSSLRQIDNSELGERFLDCVIMEGIDDELEDEILWGIATRIEQNMSINAAAETPAKDDPNLIYAQQLTGGYIDFLRENIAELLANITMSKDSLRQCTRLGKFTAFMRARPSTQQEESSERELAGRLVAQHTKLTKCLAAVYNKNDVDSFIMERVKKVSMDTSRGHSLDIVDLISSQGPTDTTLLKRSLFNYKDERTYAMLQFMRKIGILETYAETSGKVSSKIKWKMKKRFKALYEEVMEV